ncbi:MAG: molybdenum cofactor guanylyltransferase [Thermodesulfobacteriota bacterium]
MKSISEISGIILSGGKSSRMGKNKAFIEIDGAPIIQRIYDLFKTLFPEILIITNEAELFQTIEAKIYTDLVPDQGVLGGLYTGIFYANNPHAFCVACDMPFLKGPLIRYLIEKIDDYEVVVPKTRDGLQPLHAIYSKSCLGPIKKIMDQGKLKITDIYPMVKVNIVKEDEFLHLDPTRESFLNVNTPEELMLIEKPRGVLRG